MGYVSPAGSVGVKWSPLATNAPTSKICPASHSADGQIYGKGYPFPMLAPKLITLANMERKGKEWIGNQKAVLSKYAADNGFSNPVFFIDDGVDSAKGDNDFTPFRNLFNATLS